MATDTSLDHRWLERFLEHRIADRRVLRLIQKWMAAGVIEDGAWTESLEGVPQGASASPLRLSGSSWNFDGDPTGIVMVRR